jgi:anti-sigma factor RsiW
MACDKSLLAQAYLDGELDPPAVLEIEAHIAACAECQRLVAGITELRNALRTVPQHRPASPRLAARIAAALDVADGHAPARPGWGARLKDAILERRQWIAGAITGAAVAAAVAVAVVLLLPSEDHDMMMEQLANAHMRSLMPSHLVDLASADQKTVAPWFRHQVDEAPPVIDLHEQGFELAGGRTDVIGGRRVAVVVYRQGDHVVNLFDWADYEMDRPVGGARDGYNLWIWPQRHMAFCAVSDLGMTELRTLARGVNAGMAAEAK